MKGDKGKTKEQLTGELALLRQQIAGLEAAKDQWESEEMFRTFMETASDLMRWSPKFGQVVKIGFCPLK